MGPQVLDWRQESADILTRSWTASIRVLSVHAEVIFSSVPAETGALRQACMPRRFLMQALGALQHCEWQIRCWPLGIKGLGCAL